MKLTRPFFTTVLTIVLALCVLCGCNKAPAETESQVTGHIVTFDSMGGSPVDTQTVEDGNCAMKPADPTKEGFTFVEWQLDGSVYDFSAPITQDITLTAVYKIVEGTEIVLVMLDYQNGQDMSIIEIVKGGVCAEPPTPHKQGYQFIGWYSNNNKFDFSSSIVENTTLIAKWEIDNDSSSASNNTSNTPNADSNANISETTASTDTTTSTDYDAIVAKYAGKWYLDGYADVYIEVSRPKYYGALSVVAHNFSLPCDDTGSGTSIAPYTVYPSKLSAATGSGWCVCFEIIYETWHQDLEKHKVVLGNNCIYINNNKFIKQQGTIDRYHDTCYRAALGTWYLYNEPSSQIEIYTSIQGEAINSDHFSIATTRFNLDTFGTTSSYSKYGGRAELKQDWETLGIWVENGVLTLTNGNGTRTFYKEKTYQKVTGINLDITEVSLAPGKTKSLSATISPSDAYDKSLTWSSSNTSVATVSTRGVITAAGEGTATITVTTKDGGYTATCNVTVSLVRVNGISLDKTSLDMTIGNTQQLTATISPSDAANKGVTWSSSDNSVAQVTSSGKITAKGKGSATITVASTDGNFTATCTVTVAEPPLTVRASIGVGYYMSSSSSVRGVYTEAIASGGSGSYVEYYIKVYYNGTLVAEGAEDEIIVTLANGTYTAEVYVKDSRGNEARNTGSMTLSGY